jgi:general stress protein 26
MATETDTHRTRHDDNFEHLHRMLQGFRTVMLVTESLGGELRSRPLQLAEVRDDLTLVFPTSADSGKVDELAARPRVHVAAQNDDQWVSLSGIATVVRDREEIARLYDEHWKVWFPNGPQDPDLVLLQVKPSSAEYWDQAGAKGLRYMAEAAKAYVTGDTPETDHDQHAKVPL